MIHFHIFTVPMNSCFNIILNKNIICITKEPPVNLRLYSFIDSVKTYLDSNNLRVFV